MRRQVGVPVVYKGCQLNKSHVIDLLVDDRLIVEVKATEKHNPVYNAQLLTYLRISGKPVGLLINFGGKYVRDGIRRVANGFEGS